MGLLVIACLDDISFLEQWLNKCTLNTISELTARTLLFSAPFNQADHAVWATIDDDRLNHWFATDKGKEAPLYSDLQKVLYPLIPEQRRFACFKTIQLLGLDLTWA